MDEGEEAARLHFWRSRTHLRHFGSWKGEKSSENSNLITNLQRVFFLSLSASVCVAEFNKVKVAPVHISCTWKGCQEAWGSMRASPSAVLILHPRLGCLVQTHSVKRGHLTTPEPQLILFYHLYQVSVKVCQNSVYLFFYIIIAFYALWLHCYLQQVSDQKSDVWMFSFSFSFSFYAPPWLFQFRLFDYKVRFNQWPDTSCSVNH